MATTKIPMIKTHTNQGAWLGPKVAVSIDGTTAKRVSNWPTSPAVGYLVSGRSRAGHDPSGRRNGDEASFPAFQPPTFFMQHPVMATADKGEVG